MLCAPTASSRRMCGRHPGPYTACSGSRWSSATGSATSTPLYAASTLATASRSRLDEVRRQGEDGLAEAGEDRREAAERRARHLVRDHHDALGQVGRRLAGVAHREPDDGEEVAEKGEIALQERLAVRAAGSRLSRPMRRDSPPASTTPMRTGSGAVV